MSERLTGEQRDALEAIGEGRVNYNVLMGQAWKGTGAENVDEAMLKSLHGLVVLSDVVPAFYGSRRLALTQAGRLAVGERDERRRKEREGAA